MEKHIHHHWKSMIEYFKPNLEVDKPIELYDFCATEIRTLKTVVTFTKFCRGLGS